MKSIDIIGACENNLKNIDVSIPNGVICGICGVSGSGKSSLAKNVIAESGMKNFSYSLPSFVRNKLYRVSRPNVSEVNNLPPVLLIDVKNASRSSRSTVATVSDLMGTLRLIYSQFSKTTNDTLPASILSPKLFSYNIPASIDGGACSCCDGTGVSSIICEEDIIQDRSKNLYNGGFKFISPKGVMYTKVNELFLNAACKEFGINIEKPISEYTSRELDNILFGNEKIINYTDRSGSNNGKKSLTFPGIINALLDVYSRTQNNKIASVVVKGKCPICKGTRYNSDANSYVIANKTISEILEMTIDDAKSFFECIDEKHYAGIQQLRDEFITQCKALSEIGIGYLNLSRSVNSVSGGELQRIKIAKQINSDLSNCCIILDEPSTGLHNTDLDKMKNALYKMKHKNNSVIIVEHNIKLLSACDYIVEMGEGGGVNGGNLVLSGKLEVVQNCNTKTMELLRKKSLDTISSNIINWDRFLMFTNINCNNLCNEQVKLPLNNLITVVGVSGSGKSTLVNDVIVKTIKNIVNGEKPTKCEFEHRGVINDVVSLQQAQSVQNSRSIVGTLLEIMDSIRDKFANLSLSKESGYDKSFYSINSNKGTCEECHGAGIISDDDSDNEEVCPVCDGMRFKDEILAVKYNGYNIYDVLNADIYELCDLFRENESIYKVLITCCDVGLGYLSLGRQAPTLSKGEFQRIRIVKEICKDEGNGVVFVLDEPSKGLHDVDSDNIINAMKKLVDKGNTVIAVEHNLNVIMKSDYIVEMGPGAGADGGKIIFTGTSKDLINANTPTAIAMKSSVKVENEKCFMSNINDQNTLVTTAKIHDKAIDIVIKNNGINLVRGGIGSGKTSILSNAFFSIPFKKYLVSVSTQGKYYTKDLNTLDIDKAENLKLARLIDINEKFYAKNERIIERLDLNFYISQLMYLYGKSYCTNCSRELPTLSYFGECPKCNVSIKNIVHRSSFDFNKKTSKCPICEGASKVEMYDFDGIISDHKSGSELYELLSQHTRFVKIAPLILDEYGIDISKNYFDMTYDEKEFFVFGDKKKIIKYKDKEIYWDGANKQLISNYKHAKEYLKTKANLFESYCPHCEGLAFDKYFLDITIENITFYEMIHGKIEDIVNKIALHEEKYQYFSLIGIKLRKLIELGMGKLRLGDKVADLSIGDNARVQYVSYRFNQLYNTVIIWDNFTLGLQKEDINKVIEDMKLACDQGYTILLSDNEPHLIKEVDNVIELSQTIEGEKVNVVTEKIEDYHANFVKKLCESDERVAVDRMSALLTNKSSISTYSSTISNVRDLFKKVSTSYSYNLQSENERCTSCDGQGYYEINVGKMGISRRKCPVCDGLKFSSSVLSVRRDGKTIGDLFVMTCNDVLSFFRKNNLIKAASSLEVFINLNLGNVAYGKAITEVSYSEATLMMIGRFLLSNEDRYCIKNPFSAIGSEDLSILKKQLDDLCKKHKKTLVLEVNNDFI